MKWTVSTGMFVTFCWASSAYPETPLALGQNTPANACRDRNDCGFKRGPVSYVSFDKIITRREVCIPALMLFNVGRKGDRLETVRQRLRSSGWIYIKAKKNGVGWLLLAGSKTDELKSVEVTFDTHGRVKCVTEMLLTV